MNGIDAVSLEATYKQESQSKMSVNLKKVGSKREPSASSEREERL